MIPNKLNNLLGLVQKPGRYIGGEFNEIQKDKKGKTRVAFCFPDVYEIGMSNLGMRILYGVLNEQADVYCERCFAPWPDMGELLRKNGVPLYALESGDPIKDFNFVAFTLQYELCYTNVLYMLDLSGIPFYSKDRDESHPIILGGGPCTYNPEPFADFFDIISIGEGEEALPELMALYKECKDKNMSKADFLKLAAKLEGFYVPAFYTPEYNEDGTIKSFEKNYDNAPDVVKRRIIKDFENSYYPTKPIVPNIEVIHDRVVLEVARGCGHGCRFCQAGMIFRPIRERSPEKLDFLAKETVKNTGFPEISMCSLSIGDYTKIEDFCEKLLLWTEDDHVRLSLPSMRIDTFPKELLKKIPSLRKGSLTFAPEAGSQGLRDRINKGVNEEDLLRSANYAFDSGLSAVKLYFMNGLPTETDEDVKGIAKLSQKVVDLYYSSPTKRKGKGVTVNISVSCFIPKPFTPFQWAGQNTPDELIRKQKLLKDEITSKKISYSWHEAKVSRIEAVMARGDRRLSKAIETAYRSGQIFDSWDENFSFERWEAAFEKSGCDASFYANREIPTDEILPWDFIDVGVKRSYLENEYKKAKEGLTTPPCNEKCSACGINKVCNVCK